MITSNEQEKPRRKKKMETKKNKLGLSYGLFKNNGFLNIPPMELQIYRWADGELSISVDGICPAFVISEKELLTGIKKIPKSEFKSQK